MHKFCELLRPEAERRFGGELCELEILLVFANDTRAVAMRLKARRERGETSFAKWQSLLNTLYLQIAKTVDWLEAFCNVWRFEIKIERRREKKNQSANRLRRKTLQETVCTPAVNLKRPKLSARVI